MTHATLDRPGYINQYTYLRYPERVRAIIIIGATCIALPYSRWEIVALKASLPLFGLWPYEPDVQYVVIPDAGHNANQDNPEFFNRVLLEFLRTRVPTKEC